MNQLSRYMEEKGRSYDEVATDLSALLGKKITGNGVKLWSGKRNPPKAWADALGLAPDEEPYGGNQGTSADGGESFSPEGPLTREDDAPPAAPSPGAVIRPAPKGGGIPSLSARKRIEMAYGAIGTGATLITQNKGYEAVAEKNAPAIADAWITAAEQNEKVAKIVRFMESGGAVGELVVCHIILVLGMVYVSGKGPQLDFLYGSQFGGYRAASQAASVQREAEAHLNGSGSEAAQGRVDIPQS